MWYFTDVHGDYALFEAALNIIGNDNFFFGGDACDRGEYGYRIMKELLANPECCYIRGNHEQLFLNSAAAMLRRNIDSALDIHPYEKVSDEPDYQAIYLHFYNGGISTTTSWFLDNKSTAILEQLDHLPYAAEYKNFDICHAGCVTPLWRKDEQLTPLDKETLMWDREHVQYKWPEEGRMLIHGHTPIDSMKSHFRCDRAPILYAAGTKLDMDGATYRKHQLFLLNLDTLETIRLYRKENDPIVLQEQVKWMDRSKRICRDVHTGEIIYAD